MTAALIIASGKRSNRESFEPGQKIGTISAIKRIVLLFQQAGIKEIVVCGEEEEVKKLVPSMNVVFLPCPPEEEMFAYVRLGISYLRPKADRILVSHVNSPLFSVQTVNTLLASEGAVCIPVYQGKRGHPILLREACFEDVLSYHGNCGLKGAIDAGRHQKITIEVEDPGILSHVPGGDKNTLISNHDAGKVQLSWKFRIRREEFFYGPGVHQLMKLIDELHSLSDACRYMGISYSKGRKIVQTFEEQMHAPVLVTQQGGRGGGCSQLTWQARDMISRYDAFQEEAEEMLKALFDKHFGDMQ